MKRKCYDTVSEAVNDLKSLGYTKDFSMMSEPDCLICHNTSVALSPEDFEIDNYYRFEGNSDPGDAMIVYAISSTCSDIKGIVVNGYGMYTDNLSSAIVNKLHIEY